jgi:hypothetical protein
MEQLSICRLTRFRGNWIPPAASIGLVADDPVASANAAAEFLRSRGFTAEVVLDVEPELPIAFVTTDAMKSTVINFRKHMIHMPRPR